MTCYVGGHYVPDEDAAQAVEELLARDLGDQSASDLAVDESSTPGEVHDQNSQSLVTESLVLQVGS